MGAEFCKCYRYKSMDFYNYADRISSIANSKLTISGNFIYQLSLSSEGGGLASATDAGVVNKTVFIQ